MNQDFTNYSDAQLWRDFKQGSESAFAFMYEKYVPHLYSYGYRIHPNDALVKDCLQDLFVTLWLSRSSLGQTDSIKYYLFRSLRREIARKAKSVHLSLEDTSQALSICHEISSEEQLIALEDHYLQNKELEEALSLLSERQREAIYLRFYQNMSFEEVASIMDITPRAVYKLLYRAIDTLKQTYIRRHLVSAASNLVLLMLFLFV